MKSWVLLAMVAAAILTAALRYIDKPAQEANNIEIEALQHSLSPLTTIIPVGTNIGCDLIGVKTEVFLWTRYILAPRYIPYKPNVQPDTCIAIFSFNTADSLVQQKMAGRTIIWSAKDNSYHYYLTCSK